MKQLKKIKFHDKQSVFKNFFKFWHGECERQTLEKGYQDKMATVKETCPRPVLELAGPLFAVAFHR